MEFSSSNEFEIPYIEMFSLMRKNIYNYHRDKNSIKLDKTYINQRKSLIALIYKISNRMNFKSKTFYQAVNYLDIIFSKQKNISYKNKSSFVIAKSGLFISSLNKLIKRLKVGFNGTFSQNLKAVIRHAAAIKL